MTGEVVYEPADERGLLADPELVAMESLRVATERQRLDEATLTWGELRSSGPKTEYTRDELAPVVRQLHGVTSVGAVRLLCEIATDPAVPVSEMWGPLWDKMRELGWSSKTGKILAEDDFTNYDLLCAASATLERRVAGLEVGSREWVMASGAYASDLRDILGRLAPMFYRELRERTQAVSAESI